MTRKLFTLGGHFSLLSTNVEDTASSLMECVYDGRALPVHHLQDYLQRPPSRTCERNQSFLDEIAHFVACTRGESQPMVSVHDGAASLRIALAARDSMETGRVVSL